MAPAHRLAGLYAGAGVALVAHAPTWQVPAASGIAAVFAAGRTSPDVDQYPFWRRLDRWLPDEMLGHGGPLGHRRVSHWWGLPVGAAVAVVVLAVVFPGGWWWLAWSAVAGWVSHLALDWVFGKACPMDGRGPGIPVWPWWGHRGVGLDAGGRLERYVLVPALAVAGPAILAWPHLALLAQSATTAWEAHR